MEQQNQTNNEPQQVGILMQQMSLHQGAGHGTKPASNEDIEKITLTAEEETAAIYNAKVDKYWRLYEENKKQAQRDYLNEINRQWDWLDQWKYLYVRAYELKIPEEVLNRIIEQNKPVVELLCKYFTNDIEFESAHQSYSLNKGLWLYGYVGTGKTTLLRLFARNKKATFHLINCLELQNMFTSTGEEVLERFSDVWHEPRDARYFFQQQIGFCFDDLGTEEIPASYYGNKRNVMAEIIQTRYSNRYKFPFFKSHITTNKPMKEVEQLYGTRSLDRVKDMFNVIELQGGSLRG